MKAIWLALTCLLPALGVADEAMSFCYNWGCAREVEVVLAETFLQEVGEMLTDATSAAHERELVSVAVGRIFGWAGQRSPIGADRAGNFDDFDLDGRMDCIDHSINSTRILTLFARRGWLRFHDVRVPEERHRFFIFPHRTAVIEEMPSGAGLGGAIPPYFAIDSWYVDPGRPVVVMPLEEWLSGIGPDVD